MSLDRRPLFRFTSVYLEHNILEGLVLTPKALLHICERFPSGRIGAPLCGIVDKPRFIYGLPIFAAGPRRRCEKCYEIAASMDAAFAERLAADKAPSSNTGQNSSAEGSE